MDVKSVYKKLETMVNKNPSKYILTVEMCKNIKKLSNEYADVALGLIFEHYALSLKKTKFIESDFVSNASKKNDTKSLPYRSRTHENGKGPEFDGEKLPIQLQSIISAYMTYITSE